MGNAFLCSTTSCSACNQSGIVLPSAGSGDGPYEQDPLATLASLNRIRGNWNDNQARKAEWALGELYTEAIEFIHRRKHLAQNSILISSLHLVNVGVSLMHQRLTARRLQLWDLFASFIEGDLLMETACDILALFTLQGAEATRPRAVETITTFYRVAPRYRPKLKQMFTSAVHINVKSVLSQHVLRALRSITTAEHRMPPSWSSTLDVEIPGWTRINPILFRCEAKSKDSDKKYVLFKVVVGQEFSKELKKYLVENELINMSAHEGIVPWEDHVLDSGNLYLSRKYIQGMSLAEMLRSGADGNLIRALKQLLYILAYADDRNLSHGGINPYTICYDSDRCYLTDWGVERFSNYLQAKQGKAPITPHMAYTAPELRARKRVKDEHATDMWSCGAILMRILEGRRAVVQGPLASEWVNGLRPDQSLYLKKNDEATEFLCMCLQRQPSARISASNGLNNEMFAGVTLQNLELEEKILSVRNSAGTPAELQKFGRGPKGVSSEKDSSEEKSKRKIKWTSAEELKKFLIKNNVNVKKLGVGKARSVNNLFWEISNKESTLEFTDDGVVYRQVTVVEIKIYANTEFGRKILSERTQSESENQHDSSAFRFIVKKVLANETWEQASHRTLSSELGLSDSFQKDHMQLRGHRVTMEDREGYGNYPDLLSRYRIHTVSLQIANAADPDVQAAGIGLPDGDPFVTKEANVLGTERGHYWMWRLTKKQ